MSKPLVVGITGKARAGKDTLAGMLTDALHKESAQVVISPMALPIKLMLGNLLFPFFDNKINEVDRALYGEEKDMPVEGLDVTPRRMLQLLGTDWGRTIREDLWIVCKQATIKTYNDYTDVVLIPDIRFDNEAALCDVIVQVIRPHYVAPDPDRVMEMAGHASEYGISAHLIDITVHNNGTLEELGMTVPQTLDSIFSKVDTDEGQGYDAANSN